MRTFYRHAASLVPSLTVRQGPSPGVFSVRDACSEYVLTPLSKPAKLPNSYQQLGRLEKTAGFKRSNYPFLKTDLYPLLWTRCNELGGDMDASQYKDYVLAMLFVKCVSSRYGGIADAPIGSPEAQVSKT